MLSLGRITLLSTLTLIAPALRGQELPSSLGAVQGTLLGADNKQPILDASVWLEASSPSAPTSPAVTEPESVTPGPNSVSQNAVKTDPAGRFVITKVKPGDYYVIFSAQGYISDRDFVPPAGALSATKPLPPYVQKVTVTPGKTADVSLSLEHGGVIEGTVRFADGKPGYQEASGQPAGLAVMLSVPRGHGNFGRALAPVRTDAQGKFRIADVPAGSYLVSAALPGQSAEGNGTSGKVGGSNVVFYGNTSNPSRAKVAAVHGSQTTSGIDITLPSPGATR